MYNPPTPSMPPSMQPPAEKSKTPLILGGCGALGCLGLLILAGVFGYYTFKNQANSNSNANSNANKANSNSTRNDNRRDNANSNRGAANSNTNSANENADGDDQGEDNNNQSSGGGDTANLAGTSWEGTDSDRDYFRFDFLPGGRLRVTPRDGESRTGTWRMSGNNITMTASNLTWRGTVSANEISGTGSDQRGHTWTWSLTRANN